jgi:uncharacterized paraquat-inducible protein A
VAGVRLQCSACHHRFDADAEAPRCPNCGAEAGMEPAERAAAPQKLFAALLVVAVALAIAGSVLAKIAA